MVGQHQLCLTQFHLICMQHLMSQAKQRMNKNQNSIDINYYN